MRAGRPVSTGMWPPQGPSRPTNLIGGVMSTNEGNIMTTDAVSANSNGATEDEMSEKRRILKEEYTQAKGFWPEMHNAMLELDPDYLRAFMDYGKAAIAKDALTPKMRELIYLAIDACTTHLYNPGTKNHIRQALALGAEVNEILEVLQMVTLVGAHSTTEGVPLLLEVLNEQKAKP
jgi:alkylhydroperoxidase/carboxymuconolactone decarboxylase family protein YurZ